MGSAAWYFVRTGVGELEPVARSAVDAFHRDGGRLPVSPDGFVRYAVTVVELEEREARSVVSTSFHECRARDDGSQDDDYALAIMRASVQVLDEPASSRVLHTGLGTWTPTQPDLAKLRELVDARAKTRVAWPA